MSAVHGDEQGIGSSAVITARGLNVSFGQTHAVRGVDLDIRESEVLAIMGPSGSGKSTLLHVLAGVLVPESGSVLYQGKNIAVLDEAARSRLRLNEFGFVFQFAQLLPDLSVLDNVTTRFCWQASLESRHWAERTNSSQLLACTSMSKSCPLSCPEVKLNVELLPGHW